MLDFYRGIKNQIKNACVRHMMHVIWRNCKCTLIMKPPASGNLSSGQRLKEIGNSSPPTSIATVHEATLSDMFSERTSWCFVVCVYLDYFVSTEREIRVSDPKLVSSAGVSSLPRL